MSTTYPSNGVNITKRFRRTLGSVVVALAITISAAAPAYADYRTIIHPWYESRATCMSDGRTLMQQNWIYYDPVCTKNLWDSRWTLHMMVMEGGGGGGGSSWRAPQPER